MKIYNGKTTKFIAIIVLTIVILSCDSKIDNIPPVKFKRHFSKAMWVVRFSLTTKKKCDKVIQFALKNKIGVIVAQVRGRGDAFFKSEHEPEYKYLQKRFDPLKYLSEKCAEYSLHLHAWVNMIYASDRKREKLSKKHLLNKHPEWVTYDRKGKRIDNYKRSELKKNLLEGTFLDPGIPDVKNYLTRLTTDIARRYKIKGIHLDFIRYPWSGFSGYYKKYLKDFGYNPYSRMRFLEKYGIDPQDTPYKRPGTTRLLWRDFRRKRITEIVRSIYESVKKVNSSLEISAAVIANEPVVRKVYFQDWKNWISKGILDKIFPMSYSQNMKRFKYLVGVARPIRDKIPVFMGVHIKTKTPVWLSAEQIRMIYNNGFHGMCIFSYDNGKKQIRLIQKLFKEENRMRFK